MFFQFWSDYFFRAPQDNMVKTLVRNRVDTYVYVQNTTVEALRLPWWRQITHNLEHYFLSGAPFMDKVFFPEGQQVIMIGLWNVYCTKSINKSPLNDTLILIVII